MAEVKTRQINVAGNADALRTEVHTVLEKMYKGATPTGGNVFKRKKALPAMDEFSEDRRAGDPFDRAIVTSGETRELGSEREGSLSSEEIAKKRAGGSLLRAALLIAKFVEQEEGMDESTFRGIIGSADWSEVLDDDRAIVLTATAVAKDALQFSGETELDTVAMSLGNLNMVLNSKNADGSRRLSEDMAGLIRAVLQLGLASNLKDGSLFGANGKTPAEYVSESERQILEARENRDGLLGGLANRIGIAKDRLLKKPVPVTIWGVRMNVSDKEELSGLKELSKNPRYQANVTIEG